MAKVKSAGGEVFNQRESDLSTRDTDQDQTLNHSETWRGSAQPNLKMFDDGMF